MAAPSATPVEVLGPRQRRRISVPLAVVVTGINGRGRVFSDETRSVNVSGGGICFLLDQQIEVGSRLKLAIELPPSFRGHFGGRSVYKVRAVVCRVEKAPDGAPGLRVGARFLGEITE